jgi:hypothetical protein
VTKKKNILFPNLLHLLLLVGGLAAGLVLSQQVQKPQKKAAEIIDTLDYFVRNNPNQNLKSGTGENLSEVVYGNGSFYVKSYSGSYEYHTWDNDYIYLKQDSPSYFFSPGKWMKRHMKIGESIDMTTNIITRYQAGTCTRNTPTTFSYVNTLEKHISNYNAGGDLGIQDVIVLRYDYGNESERFYYSKNWGWIRWELWDDVRNVMIGGGDNFNKKQGTVRWPNANCGTPQPPTPKPTANATPTLSPSPGVTVPPSPTSRITPSPSSRPQPTPPPMGNPTCTLRATLLPASALVVNFKATAYAYGGATLRSYKVSFGDGVITSDGLSGTSFTYSYNYTYRHTGTYTVTIQLLDSLNRTGGCSTTVKVDG